MASFPEPFFVVKGEQHLKPFRVVLKATVGQYECAPNTSSLRSCAVRKSSGILSGS